MSSFKDLRFGNFLSFVLAATSFSYLTTALRDTDAPRNEIAAFSLFFLFDLCWASFLFLHPRALSEATIAFTAIARFSCLSVVLFLLPLKHDLDGTESLFLGRLWMMGFVEVPFPNVPLRVLLLIMITILMPVGGVDHRCDRSPSLPL